MQKGRNSGNKGTPQRKHTREAFRPADATLASEKHGPWATVR